MTRAAGGVEGPHWRANPQPFAGMADRPQLPAIRRAGQEGGGQKSRGGRAIGPHALPSADFFFVPGQFRTASRHLAVTMPAPALPSPWRKQDAPQPPAFCGITLARQTTSGREPITSGNIGNNGNNGNSLARAADWLAFSLASLFPPSPGELGTMGTGKPAAQSPKGPETPRQFGPLTPPAERAWNV